MLKLFWAGLKVGTILNIILVFLLYTYVYTIEKLLSKPVAPFPLSLELGSIVDSRRLFAADVPSMKLRQNWLKIQNHFAYYIIEYQLRGDFISQSPRLLKWCEFKNCVAHRIDYKDVRKENFDFFTV